MKIKLIGKENSLSYSDHSKLPSIGEIDSKCVEVGMLLKIYDDYYEVVCCTTPLMEKQYCIVRHHPQCIGDDIDTYDTDNIVCPFCGHEDDTGYEYHYSDEYECPVCGALSALTKNVSVTYTTELIHKGKVVTVK